MYGADPPSIHNLYKEARCNTAPASPARFPINTRKCNVKFPQPTWENENLFTPCQQFGNAPNLNPRTVEPNPTTFSTNAIPPSRITNISTIVDVIVYNISNTPPHLPLTAAIHRIRNRADTRKPPTDNTAARNISGDRQIDNWHVCLVHSVRCAYVHMPYCRMRT